MIEIIGTKSGEEYEMEWRELPKNVRQIGETREKRKIYMEDYVVTYLGKLAKPGQAYARGAILFGNLYRTEEGPAVFISGAMEAQNLELDMDETIFNEEIWHELLKKGEKYFPEQKVMGWFLSRMGFSVEMNQKIINTHLKNFPGNHRVLYMIDSLEKEDAIYICENQQMIRQKGYYIYYEKNSAMQEYMLSGTPPKKEKIEERMKKTDSRRDQKVVDGYRKKYQHKRNSKKPKVQISATRVASVAVIILMSVYIYSQMVDRQWLDGNLKSYVLETMGGIRSALNSDLKDSVEEETVTAQKDEKEGTETASTEEMEDATEEEKTEDAEETIAYAESKKPLYYTVKKGDTLAAISRKMYMTDKYTKEIAWANSLDNENEIYEGQKILIPSIQ